MTDVSKLIDNFRKNNPVITLLKTDKEVADLMLEKGGLNADELMALTEAFSHPEPIGDIGIGGKTAAEDDEFAKFMQPKEGVPSPKEENKKGWLAAGIGAALALGSGILFRGKNTQQIAKMGKAAGVGIAAAVGLSSCMKEENNDYSNEVDMSINFSIDAKALAKAMANEFEDRFGDTFKSMENNLTKIENAVREGNILADQKLSELLDLVTKILETQQTILRDGAEGNKKLYDLVNKILDAVASGTAKNYQKLSEILEAINLVGTQQNEFGEKTIELLTKMYEKMDNIGADNQTFYDNILAAIKALNSDVNTASAQNVVMLETILDAITENKNISAEGNELLNKILTVITEGQINDEEKAAELQATLNEIITAIKEGQEIDVGYYKDIIDSLIGIEENTGAFADILEQIRNDMNNANNEQKEYLQKIYDYLKTFGDNAPAYTEEIKGLLNKIIDSVNSGTTVNQNGFNAVMTILQGIKDDNKQNTDSLIAVIETMWGDLAGGNQKIIDALNNIVNQGLTNNNDLMQLIKELYADSQINSDNRAQAITDAVNALKLLAEQGITDNKEMIQLIKDLYADSQINADDRTQAITDAVNALKLLAEQGITDNKEMIQLIKDLYADSQINANDRTQAITDAINALKDLTSQGLGNDKEIMQLIKDLYADSQINANDRTQAVVDAIANIKAAVDSLKTTVENVGGALSSDIQGLYSRLDALLNAYQEGNKTSADVLNELKTIITNLKTNNNLSSTTNELLQKLIEKADQIINSGGSDGNINDYSAVLQEILDAINKVASGVEDIKISMNEDNADITNLLQQIIDNQVIQSDALREFAKASTANQEKLIEQGNTIISKLDDLGISMDRGIGDVINAIKESDAQLAAQLEALAEALGVRMDDNTQTIVDAIGGLESNLTTIQNSLDLLVELAEAGGNGTVDLTTTNNLIQTVINLLNRPSDEPTFDLSEVTTILNTTNAMIKELLNKDNSDILNSLEEMKEIIANVNVGSGPSGTVDLTTTNNLIQTVITQLSALVRASADNSDIMAGVTNLGAQLTEVISNLQTGNVTTDEINAKLDEILEAVHQLEQR